MNEGAAGYSSGYWHYLWGEWGDEGMLMVTDIEVLELAVYRVAFSDVVVVVVVVLVAALVVAYRVAILVRVLLGPWSWSRSSRLLAVDMAESNVSRQCSFTCRGWLVRW